MSAGVAEKQAIVPAASPQILPLTSLRFFAAAWVVVFHFREKLEAMLPSFQALRPLSETGDLGVDLFFILSGFIIAHNYGDRMARPTSSAYRRFLGLRLARMYPVHLFTLLVVAVLVAGAHATERDLNGSFTAFGFARQLALGSVVRAADAMKDWNYPAWSISAEWIAYLSFPLLALAFQRVRRTAEASIIAASVVLVYFGVLAAGVPNHPLLRIAALFTVGVLLLRVFRNLSSGPGWDAVVLVAVGVAAAVAVGTEGDVRDRLLVLTFVPMVLGLALVDGPVRRVMSVPVLRFLGEASFSLYMTHAIVEMVSRRVLSMEDHAASPLAVRLGIVAVYVAVLAAVAIGTYVVVERPSRDQWRRRLMREGRLPDAVTTA